MDFLDPKKRRANEIRLVVGYVLVGITILLGTIVLLYLAYGFSLNNGKVIQNGLVFVSSRPANGSIVLNGKPTAQTNARLALPAGTYTMQIIRNGYRTWQRTVAVEGDSVERFDYPLLFPTLLKTTNLSTFSAPPAQATQSPDQRWLLLESADTPGNFSRYDLTKPSLAPVVVNLPSGVLTTATTSAPQQLTVAAWADDNQHVLLKHTYDKTAEYILLDSQSPEKSLNLNNTLKMSPTTLTLQNKKYDHYFVYDAAAQALSTASLSSPAPVPLLQGVISYATYGNDVVLYATSQHAPAGETAVMLYQNNKNYLIRDVSQAATYLLDLAQYSGSWYLAAGSPAENRVYVYQNPLDFLASDANAVPAPVTVLKVNQPNYLSFSNNAQYVIAENANNFAAYDVQYGQNYTYTTSAPFDAPQAHAAWVDDGLLDYVSGGKLAVFDYDGTNLQTLMPASPAYAPFFAPNYKYVYALAPATAGTQLTSTALRTPADL
jgi:PEGA domain